MEESKSLDIAIAQLDRQFGPGTVMKLGNSDHQQWPSISTGAPTLDKILGIGGLPRGRIVEIYGPESSGKSTLALSLVAEAQKQGLCCAYVDAEHALDPAYMINLGIDLDELLLAQPHYGEEALEIVDKLVKTGEVGLIVIDSVASLVPKAELEGEMEANQMGLQARMMAKAMRKITALANESKTLVVFINQMRNKIGIMFGNPETTPGGMALRFHSSVRIDLRKKEDIKDKEGNAVGITVKAKVIKNKMSPPLKVAEFDVYYGRGVDLVGSLLDLAIQAQVFIQKGAWISYNGENYAQGRENAINKLKQDAKLLQTVKDIVFNESK